VRERRIVYLSQREREENGDNYIHIIRRKIIFMIIRAISETKICSFINTLES